VSEKGSVSLATLELSLPGCRSLKQKRSILRPLIVQLRREFNVSVSEVARMDDWNAAVICAVTVSNDGRHNQQLLAQFVNFISSHFTDIEVLAISI
jgi:uncharacterized protein YlxP (DUF503 family)